MLIVNAEFLFVCYLSFLKNDEGYLFECYLLFLKTDGEYLMVLWWDNHSGSAKPFSRRSHCPSSTNTDNMERVTKNIAQDTRHLLYLAVFVEVEVLLKVARILEAVVW